MPSPAAGPLESTDSGSRATCNDASPARSRTPDALSFSATSFPRSRKRDNAKVQTVNVQNGPVTDSIGQFSFPSATRTTVVTTTTTTTTDFPPFVMRAPCHVKDLDPKLYPLASSPTPAFLRNIRFDVGGRTVMFNEPEDTAGALQEMKEKHDSLRASNGTVRSVTTHDPSHRNNEGRRSALLKQLRALRQKRGDSAEARHQSVLSTRAPLSTATDLENRPRVSAEPGSDSGARATQSYFDAIPTRQHTRRPATVGLATPETDNNHFNFDNPQPSRRRVHGAGPLRRTLANSPLADEPQGTPQSLSPKQQKGKQTLRSRSKEAEATPSLEKLADCNYETQPRTEDDVNEDSSQTAEDDGPADSSQIGSLAVPTRVSPIDSTAAQDMCLPSPSLSPVTAMNSHHDGSPFDSEEQGTDTDSSSEQRLDQTDGDTTGVQKTTSSLLKTSKPSLMDMPVMLDYFESIPDELKTYVMYQLLRRCPKPTLHFVADVVNPTLKCDFLSLLPLELSLNVVKYLDARSMCRAAQVSKRWRQIINSDEKTWKHLFDSDGFVLPEGELHRAIVEGWGWQAPFGDNDWERDISSSIALKSDSEFSTASAAIRPATASGPVVPISRRLKRKAATRVSSRKLAKRKGGLAESADDCDPADWMVNLAAAEGPYAAANAAALAVPYPDVGLPSLRSLHLYKSLYQRHHAIHKSWMRDNSKPMHLAFRAHDRHVVTCLQFDTDKILTGSDDTNINVYDTKTGALRATLEGHEGGVWALEYHENTLVSGSTDRSVRVWDIERAECTQVFQGHTSTVRCLQILLPVQVGQHADGTPEMMPKQPLIITGSRDSNLRVWKLPQPGDATYFQAGPAQDDSDCPYFVRVLTGHQHSVRAIAAHGDTLVSGSYDCTVRVWKISTGETLHRLQGHTLKVYSVVLDHERNRCISGSMDNMVKVWSLETGAVLYNLEGHSSLVGLLDLKEDRLVSAAADSTLRIWDPENGQCKSTLSAHTGAITCFQHDGQKVISGSDRTLKMWDVRTGECVKDLLTDLSGVWQVRFNDRRCVAAVQRDSLTYIEVLDFGASRDGVPVDRLGKRTVVDVRGQEVEDPEAIVDLDGSDDQA